MRVFAELQKLSRFLRRNRSNTRYDAQAKHYVESVLAPHLGLTDWSILSDHFNRKIYRAVSSDGESILKVLLDGQAPRAVAQEYLYPLMESAGINLPKLIYADIEKATAQPDRISCLVFELIQGQELNLESPKLVEGAMKHLGRLHSITEDREEVREVFERGVKRVRYASEKWVESRCVVAFRSLKRASIPFTQGQQELIHTAIMEGRSKATQSTCPRGILHMDYSIHNLIEGADGKIYMIDFDGVRIGCFGFELGLALMHLSVGIRSTQLTDQPIEAIIRTEGMEKQLEDYFSEAPDWAPEYWAQHSQFFMVWAYLRALGNTAMRGMDSTRFDNEKLEELQEGAQSRLAKLTRYLEAVET